jgi:uncharacterized membrane protein
MFDVVYNIGQVLTFFVMVALLIVYSIQSKDRVEIPELLLFIVVSALFIVIWPFVLIFAGIAGILYGLLALLNWGKP